MSLCQPAYSKPITPPSHSDIHTPGQTRQPALSFSLEVLEGKTRALAKKAELEAQKASQRLIHAKELLGKTYQKSVVKASEGITNMDEFVFKWTTQRLKNNWKRKSSQVAQAILKESEKYGFDPVFLMAVIENESSFNPEVIGGCGEIGLMQLTPDTAKWIASKYGIPYKGKKSLKNPVINISIGSAYLAYLRGKFDFHSQLYLAAYNMGTSHLHRSLDKQIIPKDYSSRVMKRYVKFYTSLSKEALERVN